MQDFIHTIRKCFAAHSVHFAPESEVRPGGNVFYTGQFPEGRRPSTFRLLWLLADGMTHHQHFTPGVRASKPEIIPIVVFSRHRLGPEG